MFHTPAHKVVPGHTVVSSAAGVIGYTVGPQGAQAGADYANCMARQRGSKASYHAGYDCPAQLVDQGSLGVRYAPCGKKTPADVVAVVSAVHARRIHETR